MKLFKGQKVHVEATVESPEPDREGEIVININGYDTYANIDDIIHAEPMPFAVGDLVTWGDGLRNYTILCIDESVAFLKHGHNSHATQDVSTLRRAD